LYGGVDRISLIPAQWLNYSKVGLGGGTLYISSPLPPSLP